MSTTWDKQHWKRCYLFYKLNIHCWSSLERKQDIEHQLFSKPSQRSPPGTKTKEDPHTTNVSPILCLWQRSDAVVMNTLTWQKWTSCCPFVLGTNMGLKSYTQAKVSAAQQSPYTSLKGKKYTQRASICPVELICFLAGKLCSFFIHTDAASPAVSELLVCISRMRARHHLMSD